MEALMKKIFVGNLPFKMRGKELRELFESFGEITDSTVILDREKKWMSKGFGFVTFVNDEDAEKAISEMNGKEHEGRELRVNEADKKE
jgi:RNA recognition motif-containing protein